MFIKEVYWLSFHMQLLGVEASLWLLFQPVHDILIELKQLTVAFQQNFHYIVLKSNKC